MKLLNRKLSRFKAARLPLDLVKFRYRAGQRRERGRERERENEERAKGERRRGWTEQGMTRKSFNMVYRRRVKERNVSESFGPRKFVTRSTCKNILSGTRQRGRPTFPSPSIDRLINISPPRNFHPLAPFDPAPAIDVTINRLIRSLFG